MTYVRRRAEASAPATVHNGFDGTGRPMTSAIAIDNAVTRITREVVGRIRSEMLTPAEVCWDVAHRPEFYARLFPADVLASWTTLERWDQWPAAQATSSLMQTLKHHGNADPPWSDDYAWSQSCDLWEKRRGVESRYVVSLRGVDALRPPLGDESTERARAILAKLAGDR